MPDEPTNTTPDTAIVVGGKTTDQLGPPVAGSDELFCQCCTPPQPLVPPAPGSNLYFCPINSDVHYTYDPATGIVTRVTNSSADRPSGSARPGGPAGPAATGSFYPRTPPKQETRTVNPEDPYAGE